MVTADTITDEQIRELRASLPKAEDLVYDSDDWRLARECAWAFTPYRGSFEQDRKKVARARCAEIWNARNPERAP